MNTAVAEPPTRTTVRAFPTQPQRTPVRAAAVVEQAAAPALTRDRDQYHDVHPLFETISSLNADDPRRVTLRDRAVERCLPLAEHIARRFRNRGESLDDLIQVARLGLVKAVDRFDVHKGSTFVAFAVPTITGEVRRHFRDTGWALHVPRSLQERHLSITATANELSYTLGRSPSVSEIATAMKLDKTEVAEGLLATNAYQTLSIDYPYGESAGGDTVLSDTLGDLDPVLGHVENNVTLQPLLEALPDLERTVLVLRFYGDLTQTQIAARVGVSQMQVSRLLARSLETLRKQIG
ncbi:SigB/SigF/SigG family RNA polymerase sigma factor [Rhodococcus sp. (in: high G+C Gram-positive bacteria)]|uniref:SigB/SigF/SigG family RNA polymerase sigma factor n=1 Tax=Rhodococcus sp. TaxID=1831 RepID=UPI003BAFAF73